MNILTTPKDIYSDKDKNEMSWIGDQSTVNIWNIRIPEKML